MNRNPPKEVEAYEADLEELNKLSFNAEGWFVSPEWAKKMRAHYQALLPLAEQGNADAQGALGWLLHSLYMYSTQEQAAEQYPEDVVSATYWLMRSAENGLWGNLDGVLSIGKGEEHDQLSKFYEDNASQFTGGPSMDGWAQNMKKLKELYFGS